MKTKLFKIIQICIILLALLSAKPGWSHGDLHERILKVTKEIKAKPDSAYLYFKRGDLYFQHEEYKKSLEDLKQASNLDYKDTRLDLSFAKVHLELENYEDALRYTKTILERDEAHVKAWNHRGKILFESKEYLKAAESFMKVIEYANETFPSNYLDASICYELHDTPETDGKALEITLSAIEKLGPIITLRDRLLNLYIKYEQFNKAIQVQTEIIESLQRKESALYKRAGIFLLMDDKENALKDLNDSLLALQNLPIRFQNHLAMRELKQNIEKRIQEL